MAEESPLFRSEALHAERERFLGTIRIARLPSFGAITLAATAMAVALGSFAAVGEVTRKARLSGFLAAEEGTVALSAPQPGTVVHVAVREGDPVEADGPLVAIRTDRSMADGEPAVMVAQMLQHRIAALREERRVAEVAHRQRQHAIDDRMRSLEAERRHAQFELEGGRSRVALAEKTVQRFEQLDAAGFVAEVQVQQKREEALDLANRVHAAERALIAVDRDVQALAAERLANESALRTQLSQIDRGITQLEQEDVENRARREVVVRASEAATVTAVNVTRGQLVQPLQTLVTLIPNARDGERSRLQAHLFAPSRTVGFVKPGQAVWLRYAAFPYQKFGMGKGTIESVSRTPLAVPELPPGQAQAVAAVAQGNEPVYRIAVRLEAQSIDAYGEAHDLKAGMALDADVVQDRRRIWEWFLDPVLAASGLEPAWSERREGR